MMRTLLLVLLALALSGCALVMVRGNGNAINSYSPRARATTESTGDFDDSGWW